LDPPEHYDLVVNTDTDAWAFYTELLVAAARHPQVQPTPASRQRIGDLSLAAQVRAALAKDPAAQHLNLEVTAQAGRVGLTGVVFNPAIMGAAAAVARRVPGVTDVSCEAVDIPRVYPGPIM
jgi:osmotically-inducible protein OsmY